MSWLSRWGISPAYCCDSSWFSYLHFLLYIHPSLQLVTTRNCTTSKITNYTYSLSAKRHYHSHFFPQVPFTELIETSATFFLFLHSPCNLGIVFSLCNGNQPMVAEPNRNLFSLSWIRFGYLKKSSNSFWLSGLPYFGGSFHLHGSRLYYWPQCFAPPCFVMWLCSSSH